MKTVVTLLLLSLVAQQVAGGSFWDGIPIISQIKSAVQAIGGDAEGARRTQENFLDQAPVFSQVKSAVQSAAGDDEGARKTQEKFLHDTIEPVADNTPVIGHIKGGIHMAVGDTERGEQILKGASTNTAAVAGAIFGGPAGAIAAGAAADGVITGVDSAIHKEYRPNGVVEHFSNIDDKTTGDHFDFLAGIGLEFAGGKKGKAGAKKGHIDVEPTKTRPVEAPLGSNHWSQVDLDSPKTKISDIDSPKFEPMDLDSPKLHPPHMDSPMMEPMDLDPPGSPVKSKSLPDVVNHPLRDPFPYHEHQVTAHGRPVNFDPHVVEGARRYLENNYGLPREYTSRLQGKDFRAVNIEGSMRNCALCSLAAAIDAPIKAVKEFYGTTGLAKEGPNIHELRAYYDTVGLNHLQVSPKMDGHGFRQLVMDQAKPGGPTFEATVGYHVKGGLGHAVNVLAWKDLAGNPHMLIKDFQVPPFHPERFRTGFPVNLDYLHVLTWEHVQGMGLHKRSVRSVGQLEELRAKAGLDEEHANKLSLDDFRDVNDLGEGKECPLCPLAAIKKMTVKQLMNELDADIQQKAPKIDFILDAYEEAKLDVLRVSDAMKPAELNNYLNSRVDCAGKARFTLLYWRKDLPGFESKDIEVWKTADCVMRSITIDYKKDPASKERFVPGIPTDAVWIYALEILDQSEMNLRIRSIHRTTKIVTTIRNGVPFHHQTSRIDIS